jgi:hypothetical protein
MTAAEILATWTFFLCSNNQFSLLGNGLYTAKKSAENFPDKSSSQQWIVGKSFLIHPKVPPSFGLAGTGRRALGSLSGSNEKRQRSTRPTVTILFTLPAIYRVSADLYSYFIGLVFGIMFLSKL